MAIKKYHVSKNLFDKNAATLNERILSTSVTSDTTYAHSDYIDVTGVSQLTVTSKQTTTNFYFYNDKTDISIGYYNGLTADVPEGAKYVRVNLPKSDINTFMLVEGSTAPSSYEPYGNTWTEIPYKRYETSTDTLTTLPAEVIADGNNATVGLKGNMSQSGTPTPQNPIEPSECGERTGNLLPFSDKTFTITIDSYNLTVTCSGGDLYFSGTVGQISSSHTAWKTNFAFELEAGTYYCNNPSPLGNGFGRYIKKYSDDTLIMGATDYTFTLSETTKCYLAFYIFDRNLDTQIKLMLNTGSTALPYEPYGYKIPILSANTTTPVYLGEVQSTRQIKKVVLDGTEEWRSQYGGWVLTVAKQSGLYTVLSTHYIATLSESIDKSIYGNSTNVIIIFDSDYSTLNDFKAYLSQQYAAGTPVCVWYVLATPQTAVVNEPIRKMRDYADEVSGISIPTIAGANALSVDTTLQPSEVTVNYKGWHPVADVHERENGQWD